MQQLQLFETKEIINIKRGPLNFVFQEIEDNLFIGEISVPSGKFIIRYELEENQKISSFEILDYIGYLYIDLGIIKNIKNLTQAIIKNN